MVNKRVSLDPAVRHDSHQRGPSPGKQPPPQIIVVSYELLPLEKSSGTLFNFIT